jgi:putative hydrolase of the HAD superfamily
MRIQLVTVDFWNTIFDSSNGTMRNAYRQKVLIEKMDAYDRVIKQEQFSEAMEASWEYFNHIWKNDQRTPTPLETVEFFWKHLDLPEDEEAIIDITKHFAECILVHPPSLMTGFRETIGLLSNEYDLAIISDTGFSPGSVLRQLLEKEGIIDFFKAFSFSDETGVSKPHENAYNHILEELNCSPKNAVHIGDIEETDVLGAKKLGMKAIRFSGDKTAVLSKDNPEQSMADFIAYSWYDIPGIIDSFNNHK